MTPNAARAAEAQTETGRALQRLLDWSCEGVPSGGGRASSAERNQRFAEVQAAVDTITNEVLSLRAALSQPAAWVAVEERLPKIMEPVLVYHETKRPWFFYKQQAVAFCNPDEAWYNNDSDSPLNVLFWQPLPPAPAAAPEMKEM